MADNEEFSFEDEPFQESGPGGESFPEWGPQDQPPAKKNSLLRILLLVLLLVLIGGAAFYYFVGVPSPAPAVPPVVTQKKPIKVPAPSVPPAVAAKPAAAPQHPAAPPAPGPAVAKQAATVPSAHPQPPAPTVAKAVPVPPAPAAKPGPAPAAKPAATPTVAPTAKPPVAAAAPAGQFTLRSGAYLLKSSLAEAERGVRKLGYQPMVKPIRRKVAMTRLKVGTFSPKEAAVEVAALSKAVPDAFVLTQNGHATVYAGSYFVLDEARVFADKLFSQGIRVEEVPVKVEETLRLVSFGAFPDRPSAEAEAAKARAAGLEATVVKRR